jgi:hypothetical protein
MIKTRPADENRQQLSHHRREKRHERHAHVHRSCMAFRTAARDGAGIGCRRFVAASRSQQAQLLTQWAAAPQAEAAAAAALQKENLYRYAKHAFAQRDGNVSPLGASAAEGPTKAVRLTNRLRVWLPARWPRISW